MTELDKIMCDRCGNNADFDETGGNCPNCGDNLCATCADWIETEDGAICQACYKEPDCLPGAYPYHLYSRTFDRAVSMDIVDAETKISQAEWQTFLPTQQDATLTELEEDMLRVRQAEEEDGKDV